MFFAFWQEGAIPRVSLIGINTDMRHLLKVQYFLRKG